jgi:hypothetical protein
MAPKPLRPITAILHDDVEDNFSDDEIDIFLSPKAQSKHIKTISNAKDVLNSKIDSKLLPNYSTVNSSQYAQKQTPLVSGQLKFSIAAAKPTLKSPNGSSTTTSAKNVLTHTTLEGESPASIHVKSWIGHQTEAQSTWTCSTCTLINNSELKTCEACGSDRNQTFLHSSLLIMVYP